MKRKVRTRFLSALLTLAMLVSLMPAAFAANWEDVEASMDSDDYLSLSFLDRYIPYSDYYIYDITGDRGNDRYEPDVVDDDDDLWYEYYDYIEEDELGDFYFLSYEDSYGEYEYTIDIISEDRNTEDEEFTIYLTLYVDDGYGSSTDDEIYAETDYDGELYLEDISDDLYYFALDEFTGYPYYVCFTDWTNGEFYNYWDDDEKVGTNDEFYFDEDDVTYSGEYYLDDALFVLDDDEDDAIIEFRIYSTISREYIDGTIVVNGDGTSAGDIKYSTEYNTEVYFDGDDFEDLCYEETGRDLEYVTFTLPSSSKGTLYNGSSKVKSTSEFDSDDLDGVSFEPASGFSGDVSISFVMYFYRTSSSKSTSSTSGTVIISVDDGTTITYTGEVDEEVEFDADDFDDVCYDVYGKYLDYVKFSLPSSSKGTLYAEYDGTSKGSTAAKSTTKFYVDPDDDEYGLDDVVFVPATSGTVEISYTAYYTSGSSTKSFTGTVKITATAGTLSAINYSVSGSSYISNSGVTFSASDFTAALKAKTSKTLSSVTFTLPKSTEGVLYYNGTTRVSASTQYKATGTTNTLDKVSFVPATGVTGSVTIAYTAKDSSGNTYNGTVVVKTFVGQDTVISYSTTGPAVSFKTTDFTTACYKKLGTTLSYVQFALPNSTQGTLYYGYGTSQQARVSANAKYTAGTYLPYVSFLPKAGFSGTATITYTGYDTAGGAYTGTVQVTVTPPTKSSTFTDANASWIAPAADFLQANSVYSGVVSGSTLGIGTAVTRGEVMQMIYNAFNLKNKATTVTSNFTDVPASHPYYIAINAGYQLGITNGVGNGMFNPDTLITREDACTLLYRAFNELGLNMSTGTADDLKTFGDYATVYDYAVSAVAGMVKSGIIQGDENHNISPKSNLNRGEISVIIYRAMTL